MRVRLQLLYDLNQGHLAHKPNVPQASIIPKNLQFFQKLSCSDSQIVTEQGTTVRKLFQPAIKWLSKLTPLQNGEVD